MTEGTEKFCASCGTQILPGQKFCAHCGKATEVGSQTLSSTSNIAANITASNFCPHCGREIQAGFHFCEGCGKPLEAPPTGTSPVENEYLLGGLKTGSLHLDGKFGGYGIYATNKRLIGVTDSATGVGVFFGLAGMAAASHHDHSLKSIQELDAEKDLEVRKEQIQQIRMKKATDLGKAMMFASMNVFLNSGANLKFRIGTKATYDDVRGLIEAFYPQVIVDDA